METIERNFQERINYKGDLAALSEIVSKDFNLGEYKIHNIIPVGYEDLNVRLATDSGQYLMKIQNSMRDVKEVERYRDVLAEVEKKGIAHPKLFKSEQGYLHKINLDGEEIYLFVMEFIKGETFYDLGVRPNREEIKFLAHQASLINSIDTRPYPVYDMWAEVNMVKEYEKAKSKLNESDRTLVGPVVESFKKINLIKIPHAFVHGDIISSNVIKGDNGKLWILDFAVANYYPRIQELAVLGCDLLTDHNSFENSLDNLKTALSEYQKKTFLTDEEIKVLPFYIRGAHAMHIIGVVNNSKMDNLSKEDTHWLEEGRNGLILTKGWTRI
ncbi:phosphotransferase [Patescibacteria group bacterium]|nr:phosphotransferase [Patescibacteria group bacterium]